MALTIRDFDWVEGRYPTVIMPPLLLIQCTEISWLSRTFMASQSSSLALFPWETTQNLMTFANNGNSSRVAWSVLWIVFTLLFMKSVLAKLAPEFALLHWLVQLELLKGQSFFQMIAPMRICTNIWIVFWGALLMPCISCTIEEFFFFIFCFSLNWVVVYLVPMSFSHVFCKMFSIYCYVFSFSALSILNIEWICGWANILNLKFLLGSFIIPCISCTMEDFFAPFFFSNELSCPLCCSNDLFTFFGVYIFENVIFSSCILSVFIFLYLLMRRCANIWIVFHLILSGFALQDM